MDRIRGCGWRTGLGLLAAACSAGPPRTDPRIIERELLDPYVAALNAGDTERAWRDFTTDGFKASANLIVFEAAQSRNRDQYGTPLKPKLLPDAPIPLSEPGHPPMLRVTARWAGPDGSGLVLLDLVDGPPWRIERTWTAPEDGLATERVH